MISLVAFVLISYILLYAFADTLSPVPYPDNILGQVPLPGELRSNEFDNHTLDSPLDAWLDTEYDIAIDRLLANIAPGGRNTWNIIPGTVIASPSRSHPDYYYQWVRDAAITTSTLVSLYAFDPTSSLSTNILEILNAYSDLQYDLQHTQNPSGTFDDLSGLGEPKFNTDASPFTSSWGRPQRDGPALRALTLIHYLHAYNDTHPWMWTTKDGRDWYRRLYDASMPPTSIIKADLEYVSHNWASAGFDIWEEVHGLHFFTAKVQLRALREGTEIARSFNDQGAAEWYQQQANEMTVWIRSFWDDNKAHLVETLKSGRSGLDCGILLAPLHGTRDEYIGHEDVFLPWSDEILLTLLALVQDMRHRFPINAAAANSSDQLTGIAVGRYPEDIYDGDGFSEGNPWFLCTASVAEVLYRTAIRAAERTWLNISERGLTFWQAVLPDEFLYPVNVSTEDAAFHSALLRLKEVGDGFLGVIMAHATAEGSLSEQFDGVTGFERGAANLTWSYGAFIEAVRWRRRLHML
ncbi:MAG: Glucoamylase, intracellular sporulation-specific [Pleopsidium flavum]|nr:MAG: Glucoamylase, intracellular sporulation-specific [Pleopsidium flavum]